MIPIPDNGTDSLLSIAIDMDELVDNETEEGKLCNI